MDVRDYIEANASGFFAALKDWLAIPSISGDPERRDDVRRSAEILEAPLVFVAVGLDEDRIHAPNEKAEKPLLLKGAEVAAYLWDEFAGRSRETGP